MRVIKGTWIALGVVAIGACFIVFGVVGVAAPARPEGIDTPSAGNSPLIWMGVVVGLGGLGLFGLLRAWGSLDKD